MTRQIDSLESFVKENKEDFIFDTNILRNHINSDVGILEYLYDCPRLSNIEPDIIRDAIDEYNRLSELIDLPNVYLIEEVRKETKVLLEKLGNDYRWHKSHARNPEDERLKRVKELNDSVFELTKKMKKNELKPYGPLYNSVLECVTIFSKKFDKLAHHHERAYGGHDRKLPKTSSHLNTDEKIIATTLHKSFLENKDISIITNDGAMMKKFAISYDLISCPELYYGLSSLRKNNLRVCKLNTEQEIRTIKFTKGMTFSDKFDFNILSDNESKELKYRIDNILYQGQKDNDPYCKQ